ncbi:MAG TPA: head GIN domain-containing protein [Bacteroidales bacterium]|nr:head GIN domain-containing protein [Bacteroidales bacterium]
MKRINIRLMMLLLTVTTIMIQAPAMAQKEIAKETREVGAFEGINAGGAFDIFISQGEASKVVLESESNNLEKISTRVNNGILEISAKGIKNSDKLNVYVTNTVYSSLDVHGAASLKGESPLRGEKLDIKASGASDAELEVYYDEISTEVSGAASVVLTGEAGNHNANVSGAGDLKAGKLATATTRATASGAGSAFVSASGELISSTKGAGSVEMANKPETITIVSENVVGEKENIRVHTTDYGDTTKVKVAGIMVEVIDDDSTRITIGNRKLTVDDDGNVKWCKVKLRKFNGHWAGVEIGVNGFLTKDFDMKFRPEDEYMDLRMEKSAQVNLNLYEQNIALSKNQEWGMITGIGISWNNYRFRRPTTLGADSSYLIGYIDEGISVKKSKLAAAYLQVPLIFEWQNHTVRKVNSFHVGAGVVLGLRMWSWQKKYYNELNKEYTLTRYNPSTERYEDALTKTSPGNNKTRQYDDFHLQPFKADATLRVGWGFVNLFATYNLIPMFRKDKGPDLHQFAAGITLLGW